MTSSGGGAPYGLRFSVVCASPTSVTSVPTDERAVDGGADAGVRLGAGDHDASDASLGEQRLEVGGLERVAVRLGDQRLGLPAGARRHRLPARAAAGGGAS